MAGTPVTDFGVFLDALADNVAYRTDVIMAPLREVHNFVTLGPGQDAAIFPYASGALSMGAVTDGTVYNTQVAAPISGVTVTPAPYEVQVLISEFAVRQNPAGYLDFIANRFAQSAHTQMMSILTALYDNLVVSGSTGADLTVAILNSSIATLRGKGISGPLKAVLHPHAAQQLLGNATNVATYGRVGEDAVNGEIISLLGVDILRDSGVGNDGTDYENFLGTQDAIGCVFGMEPNFKILESGDATHIKLAMNMWFGAGLAAPDRAVWLKSDYEG